MEIIFKLKKREESGAESEMENAVGPEAISAWEKHLREEFGLTEKEIAAKTDALLKEWDEGAEEPQKTANDRQVGGNHYKDKVIQPWDVIDSLPHAEAKGFYRGNAIKYIMRAGDKGPAREDYEKAIHYLEKLLEIL